MKRITLFGDTHSHLDDKIIYHCNDADELWHTGDFGDAFPFHLLPGNKPLRAVFGNIDGQAIRKQFPREQRFICNGMDIWMIHIGGYPPHYERHTKEIIKLNAPDIFICGHSHILKIMHDPTNKKILHINPGAAGMSGFHQLRTLVKFKINAGKIFDVEVVELGLRTRTS